MKCPSFHRLVAILEFGRILLAENKVMYGVSGGRARCSPFWEDLMACAQHSGRREQWEKCRNEREDYIECLHHKKLSTRIERIKKEKENLIKEGKWPAQKA